MNAIKCPETGRSVGRIGARRKARSEGIAMPVLTRERVRVWVMRAVWAKIQGVAVLAIYWTGGRVWRSLEWDIVQDRWDRLMVTWGWFLSLALAVLAWAWAWKRIRGTSGGSRAGSGSDSSSGPAGGRNQTSGAGLSPAGGESSAGPGHRPPAGPGSGTPAGPA
jgi:hypothetical protein